MDVSSLVFLGVLIIAVVASVWTARLTAAGGITGGILALLIYAGFGWHGILLLGFFFLLGTLATTWKRQEKKAFLDGEPEGPRNAGQVMANGGAGALLGLMSWYYPHLQPTLLVLTAGAFSAATADSISSELGILYGRRFYNITTFQQDHRGQNGVVSLEGTLLGISASTVIAVAYSCTHSFGWSLLCIVVGGTAGNIVDPLLGATLERKGVLTNNAVNFINTVCGAAVTGGLYLLHSWLR